MKNWSDFKISPLGYAARGHLGYSMISSFQNFGALSKPKLYEHIPGPPTPMTLAEFLGSERTQLISFGAVYLNQKRVLDPNYQITTQDIVRIHLEPKRYLFPVESLKRRLIFENKDFLIMDKPSGLPMHPTLDNYYENLIKGVESFMGTKVFVTHRLDVPTSGLVLLAKTPEYQTVFNQLVAERRLEKVYQALVSHPINNGLKRHWMMSTDRAPKKIFKLKPEDPSYECLLEIHKCMKISNLGEACGDICGDNCGDVYDVDIKLLTGRTHQIRAQLSYEGSPILGDEMYGGKPSKFFGLRAQSLSFRCPVTGEAFNFISQSKIMDSE